MIKHLWKESPWASTTEMLPTEWVAQFRNENATPYTDLKTGEIVPMEQVWENIKEEGLYDPLIISVGVMTNTIRLESGNHRIQFFVSEGINEVPVTVQVSTDCIIHAGNGFHSFSGEGILKPNRTPIGQFVKPSESLIYLG